MKVRTEARREAILDVASQVFRELGFERATMNDIAARVGGSKATLYGYFPSKEALFVAVTHATADQHFGETMRELESSALDDLPGLLHRFAVRVIEFHSQPDTLTAHRMVVAQAQHGDIGRRYYEQGPKRGVLLFAQCFGRAMARGLLRAGDPEIAAKHFLSLVHAEQFLEHEFLPDPPQPDAAGREAIAARAVEVFLGGYAPRPPAADDATG